MRKKLTKGSTKDLAVLNYQILKQKTRSDGETVCFCLMEKNSNAVLIARLNCEGHITDSQVFVWTEHTKDKVMRYARSLYKEMQDDLYKKRK